MGHFGVPPEPWETRVFAGQLAYLTRSPARQNDHFLTGSEHIRSVGARAVNNRYIHT